MFRINPRRAVATTLYRNYSPLVDKWNRMPLFAQLAGENSHVPSFPTREKMWDFIMNRHSPCIDYLEFGVHQGHSILYWSEHNNCAESRFFGFDTFTGLPEDWDKRHRRGHFSTDGRIPTTTDSRVKFIAGLFQETLPDFMKTFTLGGPLIIHNDSDLYSSTLYCLTQLSPVLTKGTVIIFDELGDVLNEFRALQDYCSAYRRQFKVICEHWYFYSVAVELL